jgi:DtxR family Mn-dependent transcriptional regulator
VDERLTMRQPFDSIITWFSAFCNSGKNFRGYLAGTPAQSALLFYRQFSVTWKTLCERTAGNSGCMMQLTQSREDYLETIYELIEEHAVARVKDIAAKLNVRKPSVHGAINELKKHGLVEQEPYGYITLTKAGTVEAKKVVERHEMLREFLLLLGVPAEVAEHDACAMEHLLCPETYAAVKKFIAEQRKVK